MNHLYRVADAETRSISAENPRGEKARGAQARPGDDASCAPAARALGRGWKVRPCLRDVAGHTAITLADITGPGVVQHIWCTVQPELLRTLALRVAYDGMRQPSIHVPLGEFFANGIDGLARIQSVPVAVNPRGGMNAYWPMPFRERLRLEVVNDGDQPVPELFYQITYSLQELPADTAYLHACRRRSVTSRQRPEHVILDGVQGRGQYVGTYVVWNQYTEGWWGEGEVKFFIDDDPPDAPTICGTGTEDYFGGAWGFGGDDPADPGPVVYSGPYLGHPQSSVSAPGKPESAKAAHALYRWHVPDPVRFRRNLRVTVQALGWSDDGTYEPLADDVSSVAYWYQDAPGAAALLPPLAERYPA
ncbi:MAG: glycoside hydrolase family 172 protein [Planctomycetota bacterium]